jgi:gamma-D-glutamyl-L-lysine dipeptidyl-peptidase
MMNPPAGSSIAVVRVPVVPVTALRSSRSEQVSQAVLGTPVRVCEPGRRWCRIRTPDEYPGWVPRGSLYFGEPDGQGETALISDLWANLRARADSRLPALMTVYIGTCLGVAEEKPGWIGLKLPGGGLGWVEAHRVCRAPAGGTIGPTETTAILATAERFLGVPYLWGGCTPAGIDCSGFVQLVFRLHGLSIGRDTTEQVTQGRAVGFESLEPGDLVFFGPSGPASERVTHVGMMRNDHTFIHARGGQCVKINSLKEKEWAGRLAGARRFLTNPA